MTRILAGLCVLLFLLSGCGSRLPLGDAAEIRENFIDTPSEEVVPDRTPSLETPEEMPEDNVLPTLTPEPPTEMPISIDDLFFLKNNGDTQYFWNFGGSGCVLYTLSPDDETPQQLTILSDEEFSSIDCFYRTNDIIQFDFCGDWILLSIGHSHGPYAAIYHGSFASMKKDGSELRRLPLSDSADFFVIGNWIYYNDWGGERDPFHSNGCYRIRPDGTGQEHLGNGISAILLYADDGYVYCNSDEDTYIWIDPSRSSLIHDLRRCLPDGSDAVTLFVGSTLPLLDNGDYMGYYDISVSDEWVSFSVYVHGCGEEVDGVWGHNLYEADYRVRKDGADLTLLDERYDDDCVSSAYNHADD